MEIDFIDLLDIIPTDDLEVLQAIQDAMLDGMPFDASQFPELDSSQIEIISRHVEVIDEDY